MSGPVSLIVGAVVFLVAAAVGVPKVFMTADDEERLRLLTEHLGWWRVAQVGYSLGPLISSVGVLEVGFETDGGARLWWAAAGTAMAAGSVAWSWSCWMRGVDPIGWVRGSQPGWPFRVYVALTLGGLAAIGVGLLAAGFPVWIGLLVLAADVGYLILFVATDDIPPFVFYLVLLVVGIVVG